mgnify:CR=1 FL=1
MDVNRIAETSYTERRISMVNQVVKRSHSCQLGDWYGWMLIAAVKRTARPEIEVERFSGQAGSLPLRTRARVPGLLWGVFQHARCT